MITSYEYKERIIQDIESEIYEIEKDLSNVTDKEGIIELEKELKNAENRLKKIQDIDAEDLLRQRYQFH